MEESPEEPLLTQEGQEKRMDYRVSPFLKSERFCHFQHYGGNVTL